MRQQKYLLMANIRGWKSMEQKNLGLKSDYLRINNELPDVDIPKGTLVTLDQESLGQSVSVVATCDDIIDGQDNCYEPIKINCLLRELVPLEEDAYKVLKPLKSHERYLFYTERTQFPLIGAKIGDTVRLKEENRVGIIRYIGPVDGLGDNSTWFGVELIDGRGGKCNGTLGQKRYFEADPFSSVFVSAGAILPHDDQEILDSIEKGILNLDQTVRMAAANRNQTRQETFSKSRDGRNYQNDYRQVNPAIEQQVLERKTYARCFDKREAEKVTAPKTEPVDRSKSISPIEDPIEWPSLDGTLARGKYDRASVVQNLLQQDSNRWQPSRGPSSGPSNIQTHPTSNNNTIWPKQNHQLKNGDKVIWITDEHGIQPGVVQWIGPNRRNLGGTNQPLVGVEFESEVGNGTGSYDGKRCFTTKRNHAEFIPMGELIRAEDFHQPQTYQYNDNNNFQKNNFESFRQETKVSPTFASKLKATVEPKPASYGVDELELNKVSPLGQFKKSRQAHQQQNAEQRNTVASLRNIFEDSSKSGTPNSGSSDNVYGRKRSSSSSNSSTQQRSPLSGQKFVSSYLHPDEVTEKLINGGSSGSYRISAPENPNKPFERDPYASEQFQVEAEVYPSAPPASTFDPLENVTTYTQDSLQILPNFDRIHSDATKNKQIEIGTLVELHINGSPLYGVVKWIGHFPPPDHQLKMAGIEMEEELQGAGNGWHNGTQFFGCPDPKGVFVPFTHFQLDNRFEHAQPGFSYSHMITKAFPPNGVTDLKGMFGNLECPEVPGSHKPIDPNDTRRLLGRNKGIQGHQNSCYLDATLFAMFSFTSVFDCLLFRPPGREDIVEYGEVQRVLREELVNPLRKNYFVRADRVMKLRQLLDNLTSVKGLTSEEKDPEEFLTSLLSQTLRASPFLELSSGQSSHLYQLFVERDETKNMPTVQDLFEQSFLTSGIKLSKEPSVLILQMPRFGKQFKVYDRILPSMLLDVTDVIEESPRQCISCGKLGEFECPQCYGEHSSGLDSTVFCEACLNKIHNHQKRQKHKWTRLKLPEEFRNQGIGHFDCSNRRLFMELFAVVCIETSHYVSFVKCGTGPDANWVFFDSMADRKGEQHGYNIPEVTAAPQVSKWLTEEGVSFLNRHADEKQLPEQAKRLVCDAYMCFYQSQEVMMYQ